MPFEMSFSPLYNFHCVSLDTELLMCS